MREIEAVSRSFEKPDEIRQFKAHGELRLVGFEDGQSIGKGRFEPGWKWSDDVKPLAGTESCQAAHLGYCLKGSMVIRMDGGDEITIREGDAFEIAPGHDAWVVGNEACELLDYTGFANYAKGDQKTQVKAA